MSSLISIDIDVGLLEDSMTTSVGEKGKRVHKLVIDVKDIVYRYNQNVSAYYEQTPEERQRGDKKHYVGNGKVFWTNGTILTFKDCEQKGDDGSPARPNASNSTPSQDDIDEDVPF
jgi:hypothetical protein